MNKTLSSIEERIDAQQKKLAQMKAKKLRLEAVERTRLVKMERAMDTRRKILLGAYLLEEMKRDPSLDANIRKQLDGWLHRSDDRSLFKLEAKDG